MEAHDRAVGSSADDHLTAPSDNTTLTEVLGGFADAGYVGEFQVAGGGTTLRCLTCSEETAASEISQHTIRRLEGASDPADMAAIAAIACPRCGARGTLVLPFGPNASAAEALVLAELRDARSESDGPHNSAPGETVGDAARVAGHDAMPGEPAPGFSAPASTGRELGLDAFIGKVPVALTLSPDAAGEVVDAFDTTFPEFGRHTVQSLVVVAEPPETIRRRRATGTTVPLLADDDGRLMATYAASSTFPATVMIDEQGMVSRLVEGGDAADHAAAVLRFAADTYPAHDASTAHNGRTT